MHTSVNGQLKVSESSSAFSIATNSAAGISRSGLVAATGAAGGGAASVIGMRLDSPPGPGCAGALSAGGGSAASHAPSPLPALRSPLFTACTTTNEDVHTVEHVVNKEYWIAGCKHV